jgi:hypothetical protein
MRIDVSWSSGACVFEFPASGNQLFAIATTVKNVGDAANSISGLFGHSQTFSQPAWPGQMPGF